VQIVKKSVDIAEVVDRLHQASRQLLHSGETIHLQWIKNILECLILLPLVAEQNLRFGLDLQFPQLSPQPLHCLFQLRQVETKGAILLLQTGTIDADFTRIVNQSVEQIRIHPDLFSPWTGHCLERFSGGNGCQFRPYLLLWRHKSRLVFDLCLRLRFRLLPLPGLSQWFGLCFGFSFRLLGHLRCRSAVERFLYPSRCGQFREPFRSGLHRLRCRLEEFLFDGFRGRFQFRFNLQAGGDRFQLLDQIDSQPHSGTERNVIQLLRQAVGNCPRQSQHGRYRLGTLFGNTGQQRFEGMTEITHRHGARKTRTALEGMQRPLKIADHCLVFRVAAPGLERLLQ